ncbi:MAG: hypothetical protein ACLQVJ_24945 [Syntrophobacteraceae bacterium]
MIILCQLVCVDLLHDIKKTRDLAIYTVFLVLLICSNPGSVFLAPLIVFDAYRHRQGGLRTQIPSAVLLLTMVIYAIVSSSRAHWFQYSVVQDTIRAIVERVIFEAMAGCVPRYLLQKYYIRNNASTMHFANAEPNFESDSARKNSLDNRIDRKIIRFPNQTCK